MTAELTRPDLGHLTDEQLAAIDAWWRACNYLTIGQIYLKDNVLLSRPLRVEDIKPRLLGHWGTSPGLSFIYAHVSRLITLTGQQAIYLAGPGHGGPALVAASWLEGYVQRDLSRHQPGRRRHAPALPPVLQPRWHTEPRLGDDARFDPRRRRARLRPRARVRVGDGQPRPAERCRGRRRRGRDRAPRRLLEGHLLPQSPARRGGAADPAPERCQDRRPDGART